MKWDQKRNAKFVDRGRQVMGSRDIFKERTSYQALLQSVTDYVIAINRDYQVIMANDLFKNKFGMHSGGLCYKVLKNRDEKCNDCLVAKSFHDGQIHETQEAVVMQDGTTVQMHVKSTPVKNEQGEILYVLEAATDLTERKHLQKELKLKAGKLQSLFKERLRALEKSEERYRTIFERSHDGILLIDPNGKILEVNPAGLETLGYKSKDDLRGLGSAERVFQNRKDLRRVQKIVFQAGFVKEFETQLVGKDGRIFDALITSNVLLDTLGKITGYAIIIRDITRRRTAQEQIIFQNTRLTTLNAISTTISSSLDLKEVLNATIDRIREIVGSDCIRIYLLDSQRGTLNLAAHKGLSPEFISKSHVRTRRLGDGLLGRTAQTGKVQVVDNLLRSGHPYVSHLLREGLKSTSYIPLVSKGEPVGVMCVSSYSAFKFSADFLEFLTAIGNQIGVAVHNADLYENIKKAYQELKDAQEQVIRTEKLASMGKLSATIAHEINNPIAVVLTYIRLLIKLVTLKRFSPKRIKDISRYLSIMESETSRCGEIVKNLLAFSRQSKGRIKTYRIEEIIGKTLLLIAHDMEIKEIQLMKEIEPDLPNVRCDFQQIQQALMNIMSNASEAMVKGGILSVTARHSERDGFIEVAISDTGCGIPQKDLKNIFEPFFTTKEEGKGVGLGLSVAYGIITKHKGFIDVESEVGKGSTFKVQLPTA